MDPYLEHPALWPNVHQSLITYARDQLQPQLGQHYFVGIGERLYVEVEDRGIYPDVMVTGTPLERTPVAGQLLADEPELLVLTEVERREVYLEIVDVDAGNEVITVIEVLSPANKSPGRGREQYLQKQAEILDSRTNLVEIDLLRAGQPTIAIPPHRLTPGNYHVAISRPGDRRKRELYRIPLQSPLPRVRIPLRPEDADVVLDLPQALEEAYEKGAYARRINRAVLPPLLDAAEKAWVANQLEPSP